MANFEREKNLAKHLLKRLALDGAIISNPNTNNSETGVDVLLHVSDDRSIGIQVTEIDPHLEAGKARGEEKKIAGPDANAIYHGWAQNDSQIVLAALCRAINRKVAIADRHAFSSFNEVWLLICAGIPEHGAVISTFVMTSWLSAEDLNLATNSILQQSKYDHCFFLAILGAEQALYRWERNCGWKKSVKLDDLNEIPREAYVKSLHKAASAGDWQEVDRLCDEECKQVLSEIRASKGGE